MTAALVVLLCALRDDRLFLRVREISCTPKVVAVDTLGGAEGAARCATYLTPSQVKRSLLHTDLFRHSGVERVDADYFAFGEHVALHGFQHIGTSELP